MGEIAVAGLSENRMPMPLELAANPLLGRAQQEVKSAVHRELIDKVDLEKLLYLQDSRGRQQLQGIVLQLVGAHGVPSAPANAPALPAR